MKYTRLILPRASILLAIFAAVSGFAANPENVTVNASVPTVANLAVDTNTVSISFVSGDYDLNTGDATKAAAAGSTFQIATNRNWTLSVKAGAANFTFTPTFGGDSATKPAGDLGFKLSAAGSYTTVTTSDQTVSTGSRGGYGTAGNSPVVDYSLSSDLGQDAPGAYSLTLVYTLTSS